MSDSHSHLTLVGDICVAAALGRLVVAVETDAGEKLSGVPETIPTVTEAPKLDDTGYGRCVLIDSTEVPLGTIVACAVHAPVAGL